MRSHGILITTLAAASLATSAAAQTTAAEAAAQAEEQVREQARQNAITDRYLTAISVEMSGKVDTKNAAVGQEVSVHTLQEARLADGTLLPKGTRLVGRVIQAKPGGEEIGSAVLMLTFDRAEVKAGQSINVRVVIRAVAANAAMAPRPEMMTGGLPITLPSAANAGNVGRGRGGVAGGMPGTVGGGGVGTGGAGRYPGTNNPQGGMPGGGGIGNSGGGTGGPIGMPGSTAPSVDSVPIGGSATNLGSLGGSTTGMADRRVADAGESVSGAPKATGLPGVVLWATPTASGRLTALGKNISLESGVQLTLGVITR